MNYIEELKSLILYKKPFFIPINEKDKRKGSSVFLVTPNYESSSKIMNLPYIIKKNYLYSYYLEKDITYYINQENNCLIRKYEEVLPINEDTEVLNELSTNSLYFKAVRKLVNFTINTTRFVLLQDTIAVAKFAIIANKAKTKQEINHAISILEKNKKMIQSAGTAKSNHSNIIPYVDKNVKLAARDLTVKNIDVLIDKLNNKQPITESTINEEVIEENLLISKEDFQHNVEKWSKGANNILYITGLSGSGKTTLAEEYEKKYNAKMFELDGIEHNYDSTQSGVLDKLKEAFPQYKNNFKDKWKNTSKEDFHKAFEGIFNRLEKILHDDKDTLYIIEGLQLFDHLQASRFKSKPIIIKGTSTAESIIRRFKRNSNNGKIDWKSELKNDFPELLKWYLDCEKNKNKFEKEIIESAILEEVIEEYKPKRIYNNETYEMADSYLATKDLMIFFNEMFDEQVLRESDAAYNGMLKKLLYQERIRNNKEILNLYDKVKEDNPWIRKTFIDLDRYQSDNLFVDLSYYNNTFFKNNIYKLDKGVNLYLDFINRFIEDKRLTPAGYTKKTLFIPITEWEYTEDSFLWEYRQNLNPISILYRIMRTDLEKLKSAWKNYNVVFLGDNAYFKLDFNTFESKDISRFLSNIKAIINKDTIVEEEPGDTSSAKAITAEIIDKIEQSQKIKINNLTGEKKEITQAEIDEKINKSKEELEKEEEKKTELVKAVQKAAEVSDNTDDAVDKLNEDEYVKKLIMDLAREEDEAIKINNARAARINDVNDKFLEKKIKNTTVKDLINKKEKNPSLPETELPIDSVNEEWKHLTYMNFEKTYSLEEDIAKILYSFSDKSVPVLIRNIDVVDTSTSEDYKETYTVECEDALGQRFTLKFDVPRLKRNRFMRLRGNEKTMNGQLLLFPIIKTDEDTCQIVTNYNKIFIRRFGTAGSGKSFYVADIIVKTLAKLSDSKNIKITVGDNNKICSKYELPADYIDLAGIYSKLETKGFIFYFNQDEIRQLYKIDNSKGVPFAYNKKEKNVIYWNSKEYSTFSECILLGLESELGAEFSDISKNIKPATKYMYSKASILNTEIPLIVVMAYSEGLQSALKKSNIDYEFFEKKQERSSKYSDYIKFSDGYLYYWVDYNSSMLMNGLKECATDEYSLKDINSKTMWVNFLDNYGGRIKADGLDNFYDLMMDPITKEVCEILDLPSDYIEALAYANMLLADNKYNRHIDITGNRLRTNEMIAAYVYKVLADSYADYRNQMKRNRKGNTMSVKQTEVIDRIMMESITSDLSDLNDLLNLESANTVGFKGPSGMNSDRSYGLDKRTFDESMVGVLAMSTGFAANVGLVRQTTIDMNLDGKRGFIKPIKDKDKMTVPKVLCMAEALTPMGTTSDDPFRSAMTFIQKTKHGMRTTHGDPLLISNGADEALPYMTSDTFAYKAKKDGKVIEKTDEYLVVEYKDGTHEFVDLRENVKKNSDGGFFITIKLDSDLKVGATVKENTILAYDRLSYTKDRGPSDNVCYNTGTLVKLAILVTDEGYEDSAIISEWLSEAMSSDVVVRKDITLPKNANIYEMAKKGQPVQEGDPLIIFQNAFDEDDLNILLKNLTDEEDIVSDLGRIPIKSKVTGVVQDINILRTVETSEMSSSLKAKVNEYDKEVRRLKKIVEKYDPDAAKTFTPDYKLDPTGKLKNAQDAVYIEFYLKYRDKMSVGDKLVYYSALKGVVKDIFPKGKEPKSEYRPEEAIDSLLSQESVDGRMVDSILKTGAINKGLIELDRQVKEIMGIKWEYLHEMAN